MASKYYTKNIFTTEDLFKYSLKGSSYVCIIDSCDLNLQLFGCKTKIPDNSKYRLFYIRDDTRFRPFFRLIECRHGSKEDKKQPCLQMFHDFNKLFDHIRGHTYEKPFSCKSCGSRFT
jgi:hypothetical protein